MEGGKGKVGDSGDSGFLFLVSLLVVPFYALFDSWESADLVMVQVLRKGGICVISQTFP